MKLQGGQGAPQGMVQMHSATRLLWGLLCGVASCADRDMHNLGVRSVCADLFRVNDSTVDPSRGRAQQSQVVEQSRGRAQ